MAKLLIVLGVLLVVAGGIWLVFPKAFAWFGQLPGDVRIETERVKIFIPVTSMLVVSVLGSLALNVVFWIMRFLR